MPRTQVAVTATKRGGQVLPAASAGDVANGNYILNSGKTLLEISNIHATLPYTITIHNRSTVDGDSVAEKVVTITALTTQAFGPYDTATYSPGDGQLWLNPENASITIRAIEPGTT